jgi:glycosyltransferase involved in cell wall biosynthesis
MPRVSVIIPCYNSGDLLYAAVNSVLAQTYRDFEIIVVDDASTDATVRSGETSLRSTGQIASALDRGGPSVRYLRRETNGGVSAARNDGIQASTGEFICFLDCDDLYLPRRLERAVVFLDHNPTLHAAHADCEIRGPGRQVMAYSMIAASGCRKRLLTWRDIALHEPLHTSTTTIRRPCFDQVGLFDESLRRGQDSEMWLRLSYRYPIAQLPGVVAVWQRRETRWRAAVIARRAIAVWQAAMTWLPDARRQDLRFAATRLARAYWRLALALHLEGDPQAARARRQAIAHCLSSGLAPHLLEGMACWSACRLLGWAREACRLLASFRRPASQELGG